MAQDTPNEFDELMNDPNLTEETLQAKLEQYRLAIKQEYEVAVAEKPEEAAELTTEFFKANSQHAAAQIQWLSIHADSETVRLAASKYIIEKAFKDSHADGDPIKEMIQSLKKVPTAKEPT